VVRAIGLGEISRKMPMFQTALDVLDEAEGSATA
jgi:hypothetical protein